MLRMNFWTRPSRRSALRRTARFAHPLQPEPRTALLLPGFIGSKNVRVFAAGWDDAAMRFQPESIAASLEELRRLLHERAAGLETLRHAVIALTFEGQPALSAVERELFWRAWGVPLFEQYWSTAGGELLAGECEAHQGLHIAPTRARTTLTRPGHELHNGQCGCGSATPRLVRLENVQAPVPMAIQEARLVS